MRTFRKECDGGEQTVERTQHRPAKGYRAVRGGPVANRFVFYGTHQGEFMGVAPTGREVRFTGLSIDRVVDGKIVENWIEGDLEDLLRQIGAVVRAAPWEEASPT